MCRRPLSAIVLGVLVAIAAAVPAPAAARGTVVAVLDSGVDFRHPALEASAWRNPREIPRNRRDDDGNGLVDDVHGADFVGGDGSPRDPRGHGTHVAGIVARAKGVRIMAVRILGRDGTGSTDDLAAGIDYAAANGARVINLSVGGYGDDPAVRAALERAAAAGAVVVAAAGNSGRDLDRTPDYPASYRTPGMLVVGAARRDGRLARWSARGTRSIDLIAPGVRVRSTLPRGRYGYRSGTSQAAAAVSRAIAARLERRPAPGADGRDAAVRAAVDTVRRLVGG